MFNWYMKIMTWLSPSVDQYQIRNGIYNYDGFNNNQPASAAQIAAELAKINPTLIKGAPRSTAYTPNPYTQNQLAQFNQPQGVQGNPYYQQYLNKMAKMGAGAGYILPSVQQHETIGIGTGTGDGNIVPVVQQPVSGIGAGKSGPRVQPTQGSK